MFRRGQGVPLPAEEIVLAGIEVVVVVVGVVQGQYFGLEGVDCMVGQGEYIALEGVVALLVD